VDRVALGGISEGGSTAAMYAATYPQRVSHLVLFGSFARADIERGDAFMPRWARAWGTPETLSMDAVCPSKLGDPAFLPLAFRLARQALEWSGGGLAVVPEAGTATTLVVRLPAAG